MCWSKHYVATDLVVFRAELKELQGELKGVTVVRFDRTREALNQYKDGGIAIIEQWICAHARWVQSSACIPCWIGATPQVLGRCHGLKVSRAKSRRLQRLAEVGADTKVVCANGAFTFNIKIVRIHGMNINWIPIIGRKKK